MSAETSHHSWISERMRHGVIHAGQHSWDAAEEAHWQQDAMLELHNDDALWACDESVWGTLDGIIIKTMLIQHSLSPSYGDLQLEGLRQTSQPSWTGSLLEFSYVHKVEPCLTGSNCLHVDYWTSWWRKRRGMIIWRQTQTFTSNT